MGGISDIKKDLPMSMTMAAFTGVSWYICIELNLRLFMLFKRRKGLYFWSCVLGSWGLFLQPLTIMMTDFGVWTDLKVSIPLIYLSWWIMVIPQSFVLYSRLHLVMRNLQHLKWVLYLIIFTAIVFSIPTIIIGVLAQATTYSTTLAPVNLIWDRVQVTVFFLQESLLSILYILKTRKNLKDSSHLDHDGNISKLDDRNRQTLHLLIYTNILIIFLDITLLGIAHANLFYLQGAYKPCVYGVKLRIEFAILNRLINSAQRNGSGAGNSHEMTLMKGQEEDGARTRSGDQDRLRRERRHVVVTAGLAGGVPISEQDWWEANLDGRGISQSKHI